MINNHDCRIISRKIKMCPFNIDLLQKLFMKSFSNKYTKLVLRKKKKKYIYIYMIFEIITFVETRRVD